MESELKDLLDFLFQRADAMQTFWNFYVVVVTAVLGVITTGKPRWLSLWICLGLTVVFLIFAAANYWAIDLTRAQRQELINIAMKAKDYNKFEMVIAAVGPPSKVLLRVFHIALDAAVLAAIWGIPYMRRRYELTNRSRRRV